MKKNKNRALRLTIAAVAVLAPTLSAGCMHHSVRVEPVTIAPMRVTMDVNLRVDDARASTGEASEAASTASTPAE